MAKKNDEVQQGCLGTACSDSTCLACQVAQADRHHAETLGAIKTLTNSLSNIAEEIRAFRGVPAGIPTSPPAQTPASNPAPVPQASASTPTPTPAAAPEKPLTVDAVRPMVLDWIKVHGRDKFVAVLAKFGAAKLPDIKDADLSKLVAELKAVGGVA